MQATMSHEHVTSWYILQILQTHTHSASISLLSFAQISNALHGIFAAAQASTQGMQLPELPQIGPYHVYIVLDCQTHVAARQPGIDAHRVMAPHTACALPRISLSRRWGTKLRKE